MQKLGKWIYLFLFVLYFACFYVLSKASILGMIYPFAIGFMFALVWAEQKVWLVAPAYILASVAAMPTFENAIGAAIAAFMIVVPFYVHILAKKRILKWELGIYCLFAQTGGIVFAALGGLHPAWIVAQAVVQVAFMYVCIKIFEPLIIRGFAYRLTCIELICGGVILTALSGGLAALDIAGFCVLKLFVAFVVLTVAYTSKSSYAIMVAGVLGCGSLLSSGNPLYIAPFVVWALAVACFKSKQRALPFVAIVLADLLAGFGFNLYYSFGLLQIAPVIAGGAIFLFLPSKIYNNLSTLFAFQGDRLATKNLLNRSREMLYRRLCNLSEVFHDTNEVFKSLIRKNLSQEEVNQMLYQEVKDTVCKNCPEYIHCHRTFNADTRETFENLLNISRERGKATLLDVPSHLTSRCKKMQILLSEINTLSAQYKSYSALVGSVDTSKMLISDQLQGISQILKQLALEAQANVSFDTGRENRIIDELANNNIICTDAVVFEQDKQTFRASLIVRNEDVDRQKLPQVVSKICGCQMCVAESYPSARSGLSTVNLATAPRYDCVFGLASATKAGSGVSGDCHSVVRLDGHKFLFALCDGMGSGEQASRKSETTIGLLENFYKAGFDNDIILSSINKLLNLEQSDTFSTIDACILDLKSGTADFVKMGSPPSAIRRADRLEVVSGSALPAGILQEAKASSVQVVLNQKDLIVLCSDGVSDSFASDIEFQDFIFSIKSSNPQEVADEIIKRVLATNNGFAVDDATCLVIKMFVP